MSQPPSRAGWAGRAGRRGAPASWPLRRQLLAGISLLLVGVLVVTGAVTLVVVGRVLTDQVDAQVAQDLQRTGRALSDPGGPPPGLDDDLQDDALGFLLRGLPVGALGARVSGGEVTAGTLENVDAGFPTVDPLTPAQAEALADVRVDGSPETVDLPGRGSYRVLARATSDGGVLLLGRPLDDTTRVVRELAVVIALVAVGGIVLAVVASGFLLTAGLAPLRRVAATATRVSELPLDRGEVAIEARVPARDTDPRTEVGQVGAALNRMLGHVGAALTARHESETQVRQFVADASHELRTPLASIRGYAELARRQEDQVPPEVAHALERVESQAQRMTGLVEDLLLLARLDAGRPLEVEEVELPMLVVEAVSDAQVTAPDHRWLLDLPDDDGFDGDGHGGDGHGDDGAPPLVLAGDGPRLHQVLAGLLANARTHTPPGTTVTTRLRASADGAEVVVEDDGPGIAPEVLPHVFERFARADTSRSRAAGSTGLGLAIARAVVEAHGGRITVESRPGRTAFRVQLPWTPSAGTAQQATSGSGTGS